MKISKRELVENGVEVDKNLNKFVLKVIKTNEIHYSYNDLEDLIKLTNKLYNYNDEVVE